MKAIISTNFNLPANKAWALVKQSNTLINICKGMLSFQDANNFPDIWTQGSTVMSRLKLFGLIPAWEHTIHFQKVSESEHIINTLENGGLVNTWNHEIKIEAIDDIHCTYTDTVEIRAGLFTPLIWLYANILYRFRQRRWKKLIARQDN